MADKVRKLAVESKDAIENTSTTIEDIISQIEDIFDDLIGITASTEEQASTMEEISASSS